MNLMQRLLKIAIAASILAVGALAASGWQVKAINAGNNARATTGVFETTYQAVVLDAGQVYFGRLSGLGTPFPVLADAHAIQLQMDPKTKQTRNVLVKIANQGLNFWFEPDKMTINAQHIVAVEPVAANSTIDKLIRQSTGAQP